MDMEDTTIPTNFKSSPDKARETWQLKNNITTTLDPDSRSSVLGEQEKPWTDNPLYFQQVEMSELALLKMNIDASSHECTRALDIMRLLGEGSTRTREVVGLLMGKIYGDAIIVVDAVALPAEDTETSDHLHSKLINYFETQEKAGGLENVVGWYRTSIFTDFITASDVDTQMRIQELKEPTFAVVIDSCSTIDFGQVGVRAFRSYPKSHVPPVRIRSNNVPRQLIELKKHLEKCYALRITYYKSPLTTSVFQELWEKYWRRLVSMWSKSVSETEKTVDQTVSVDTEENNGGLIRYYVEVKREYTKQYKTVPDAVNGLFVKLVEDAGSSGDMIRTPMSRCFFISLTEEQAKKLADRDCVQLVRREYTYRPAPLNVGNFIRISN